MRRTIQSIMSRLAGCLVSPPEAYHRWYYDTRVWTRVTWEGVQVKKSVQDLWNYQEIIWELRPAVILEFGVFAGGSSLWFARVLDALGSGRVISVDIDTSRVPEAVRSHPRVELITSSSTEPELLASLALLRSADPAQPWFVVLDSDHSRDHVYAELEGITPFLRTGDYVIVEDANINGHPVMPEFGPGPFEAVEDFMTHDPGRYRRDEARERKFGWSFAPAGFLIRM